MFKKYLFIMFLSMMESKLLFLKKDDQNSYGRGDIKYELAPFGKFPYGRELYGTLHYENVDGCSPFTLNSFYDEFPPMLLLNEGGCNIKQKAINAEAAGADMVIVIRENQTSHDDLAKKTKDLIATNVDIPTITVDKRTGEKLSKLIRQRGELVMKF